MRILVTGGAGFIGSNLVRHLLQATDHQVANLDKLTYAGNLESLQDIGGDPRYQFYHADIACPEQVADVLAVFRPDAVIHLAAESHVDRSIDGPRVFVETNIVGTFQLLQASLAYYRQLSSAPREAFRFLHVSTDEVFGSLDDGQPAFDERARYAPHSPYSASKASSDHLARAWRDTYGLPVLVTHCSNNYGPYQFPEKLVPTVILKALRGEPIPVYGDGRQIRDWLFVRDHAEALQRVLERGAVGATYNIGGACELRNRDLVERLCGLLDVLAPAPEGGRHAERMEFVEDRPGHDYRCAIDAGRLRRELDWAPAHTLDEALPVTVRWYLENRWWWERILSGEYRMGRLGQADRNPGTRARIRPS